MRINTNLRRSLHCGSSQRGTALMEFLFALPFLFFILILSVNFCRVMLMKQRATMAVRYVAFTEVHGGDAPTSDEISNVFFPGESIEVSRPVQSGSPGEVSVPDESGQDQGDTLGTEIQSSGAGGFGLSGFMNSLSGTNAYQLRHAYQPVFARGDYWGKGDKDWFPEITVSASLSMDSKDWRRGQMSIGKMMGDMLRQAFGSAVDKISSEL